MHEKWCVNVEMERFGGSSRSATSKASGSGGFLPRNETRLPEAVNCVRGQLLKLPKEHFVTASEIETGLALHARLQFFRHAVAQTGVSVNAHEVIAHIRFSNLNPGDGYHRPLHFATPGS